ncbi:hypothetical protein G9A89_006879 [Geosiphon pyriformis]|nr:hypothetical protein G9A89_006879 [Geosiphon pyriformis]
MTTLNLSPTSVQAILIPGNGCENPEQAIWYPWVAEKLCQAVFKENGEKLFPGGVILRQFPDWVVARESVWLPFLEKELKASSGTVLVGHSSGAVAALRYLETHRVLGVVLVSAYHTDLGEKNEKNAEYFSRPWDWSLISKNAHWIIQFASDNDRFLPIDEQRYVHTMLGSDYHELKGRGHFTKDLDFPELVNSILEIMKGTIPDVEGTDSLERVFCLN